MGMLRAEGVYPGRFGDEVAGEEHEVRSERIDAPHGVANEAGLGEVVIVNVAELDDAEP